MNLLEPTTLDLWISSPHAIAILGLFSFSESAFFIIPPEVMVIPMSLSKPHLAIIYAIYISVMSILGAIFGYWIGKKGGKPILYRFFKKTHILAVKNMFQKYDTKAVFIAAFTPIPFKVFTISAGVFDINFKKFFIASALGRSSRYLILGILITIFGESIKNFIEHQLDLFITIGTIGILVLIAFYKIVIPMIEEKWLKKSLKDYFLGFFKAK